LARGSAPESAEQVQSEEMRKSEYDKHSAHFFTEELHSGTGGVEVSIHAQRHGCATYTNETEPDRQKAIHRVREFAVAVKCVDQKGAPVMLQRSRHPDGYPHAQRQIGQIAGHNVHSLPLSEHVQFEHVQLNATPGSEVCQDLF
jgi:hypothetical protein